MSGMESEAQKRKAEHQEAQRLDALRRRSRGESGRLQHYLEQERNELRQEAKLANAVKGAADS